MADAQSSVTEKLPQQSSTTEKPGLEKPPQQSSTTEKLPNRKSVKETTLSRERELANEWKRRDKESQNKLREERYQKLADLSSSTSSKRPPNLELTEDGEYASLMEKYGHKIRVPLPALPGVKSSSVLDASEQMPIPLPRRPRVPKALHPAPDFKKEFRKRVRAIRRMKQQSEEEDGTSQAEQNTSQKTQRFVGVSRGSCSGAASVFSPWSQTKKLPSVAEQCRSLMPKMGALRREQKALLKKTPVTSYRSQMKEHFDRILVAAESPLEASEKSR